ncbi:AAA family ATPase [Sulfurisphaera javensis]
MDSITEELRKLAYIDDNYKVELNGNPISSLIKINVELTEKEVEIYSSQNVKIVAKLKENKLYSYFMIKIRKIETIEDVLNKELLNLVAKDEKLLMSILNRIEVKPALANFIDVNKVLSDVYLVFSTQSEIASVLFVPYGRQVLQSEPNYFLYKAFKEYYYEGVRNASDKYVTSIVRSLTELDVGLNEKEVYFRLDGEVLNVAQVSAIVSEISSLLMPLQTLSKPALVLVEEPESQLHPAYQVALALVLLSLTDEYKFVITTHSDIIPLIIGEVIRAKPSKEQIEELLSSVGVSLPADVIEKVEEVIKNAKVKVYYVKDGSVNEADVNEMYRAIPGITEEVMNKILEWELKLP